MDTLQFRSKEEEETGAVLLSPKEIERMPLGELDEAIKEMRRNFGENIIAAAVGASGTPEEQSQRD